ncbi:hypothetical protein [Halosolutus gelatinilyticus]|uniref:hypothetical protein n=1 Tax=Halosolutus gelatinilyticus TaxID=2931975 RepID=UPI001FF63F3E|nr:hypothetical protein [Halosolutus gelatinilyticus]
MSSERENPALARYDEIQARDSTDVGTALKNLKRKRIQRRQRQSQAEHEAFVRKLVTEARAAIAGESHYHIEDLLLTLHWTIKQSENLPTVLDPSYEGLDAETKTAFHDHDHVRSQGGSPPDPERELETLAEIAEELGIMNSIIDTTRYAPVRFASIDEPGAKTTVDEPTPVGRLRIPRDSAVDLDDRLVEIPHQSCDHIGAIALPRRGKDSTLVSLGKNLQSEHGYSYISIMDDGRMETPMIAIPNDEQVIQQNLDRFEQESDAMAADVFVPAMGDIPNLLPSNFRLFTIGIDCLTPHLILRLAGVTKSDETVEARIKKALDETLTNSGSVSELVSRLQVYAREMEATIEWTEIEEKRAGETSTSTYTAHYQMDAESALETAAQRLGQLAAEGLITSPSAATNLDMVDVIANQERAAVLCCNFLGSGLEPLKYVIMDLWLRLIYKARDENPRLPRVCIEIRELKNIAPSKMADVRYKDDIKTLRQTIFFLTTQGGSRRILLLGSTQKWNDVYKPVRSNIAIKFLLQLGEDEIDTLDRTHHFSWEQQRQLSEFDIGWGMIISEGKPDYPVELRGAPCGLGLGDRHWRDRYGIAWGARVREHEHDSWRGDEDDPEWWVDVVDCAVYEIDADGPPAIGDWFLLREDLEGVDTRVADGAPVAGRFLETPADDRRAWVDDALEQRRELEIPNDLLLQPSGHHNKQRSVSLAADDLTATVEDVADEYGVPEQIRPWLEDPPGKREKLIEAVTAVHEHDGLRTTGDVAEHLSYSASTLRNYWSKDDGLGPCWAQKGKDYVTTPIGKQAATLDWESINDDLSEYE